MALLTVTIAVDDADLERFIKTDPDLRGSFAARLEEVYGDNDAMLTTGQVQNVIVGEQTDQSSCDHAAIVCTNCGDDTAF